MKTFKEPLTPKEEKKYLERYAQGDKLAKDILIESNLRLVAHVAKKYSGERDNEDLISIGIIGLIKAINSFDINKGNRLGTYAAKCIENEILMFLRKNISVKSEVSIDEPLNVDWDGNELLLSDVLGTDDDIVNRGLEDKAEKQILLEAMQKLSKREKQIIIMRFGLFGKNEKTQREVAELLGISQSYISRLEKRIVAKLKKEVAKIS